MRGVPTVTLVTSAFDVLAATAAKGRGVPHLPRVALPHPLNPLPEGRIREIVRQQARPIVEGLTRVPQPVRA